eukprot:7949185-Pyramimonas_sp.AAC.1
MGTKLYDERAWRTTLGHRDDCERREEPRGRPDAQSAGNDPDRQAPRHSASPMDGEPQRQMSNLADIMGAPVCRSEMP